jgi:uncharacterized protein with GYD domain
MPATSEETAMAYYLYQISYTPEAMKAMVTTPSDRSAAAKRLVDGLGGTLHHLFFSFGDYDVVCLVEAPDDATMAAAAMAVASAGTTSRSMTTKLLTSDDAMSAMKMAGKATGSYVPPMG